ncbi:YlqD family protein [Brevibacillus sp. TJ4]|uniref:YlqD family protein n=1 Tax=Brevibacillus sp. TJ4 TaxID=3234853 RepID=UPI0037CEECB1
MITIFRNVQVKVIITEASRAALMEKFRRQMEQQQNEWAQWQFQSKKILADAKKVSAERYALAQEKVEREQKRRQEAIANLQFQLMQAEKLPVGAELDYQTVQSPVEIKLGDVWDEIMAGTEIMVKDGRVHEIRQTELPIRAKEERD